MKKTMKKALDAFVLGMRLRKATFEDLYANPSLTKDSLIWVRPNPVSYALHFRNNAAKRRAFQNLVSKNIELSAGPVSDKDLILHADPKDIVKVPLYKGIMMSLAAQYRGDSRRNDRREAVMVAEMEARKAAEALAA